MEIMKYKAKALKHTWRHTRKRRVAGVLVALVVLTNAGLFLAYRNRTYPNTSIKGQQIGSISFKALPERIRTISLLPQKVTLTHDKTSKTMSTASLGMTVDNQETARNIAARRSWLPMLNLMAKQSPSISVPVSISVKPIVYQKQIATIAKDYEQAPTDAALTLQDGNFAITPETKAVSLDISGSQARIVEALAYGRDRAELMTKKTPPTITQASLAPSLAILRAQRDTGITVDYQTKSKKFSSAEVGQWFVQNGTGFTIAETKVNNALFDAGLELGVNPIDTADHAKSIKQSIENKKAARLMLSGTALGKKTITYCTAARGVTDSELSAMNSKAASTLNAKRGWSLGGNVTFQAANANCEFTLWLVAADQMPTFGAICDAMWSCAVRPNVAINYDRWRGASDAWNKDGGSLEDYRVMVINHEVGHWLGFDHSNCPGSGQAAPVMQQQSIDLQGCSFSPWPSSIERTALRSYLGL